MGEPLPWTGPEPPPRRTAEPYGSAHGLIRAALSVELAGPDHPQGLRVLDRGRGPVRDACAALGIAGDESGNRHVESRGIGDDELARNPATQVDHAALARDQSAGRLHVGGQDAVGPGHRDVF